MSAQGRHWYEYGAVQSTIAAIAAAALLAAGGLLLGIPQTMTKLRAKAQKAKKRAEVAEQHADQLEGKMEAMQSRRQDFRERVLQQLATIQANQEQLRQELQEE